MKKAREKAIRIIAEFEELLNEKEVSIPCEATSDEKERKSINNSARIFGTEYYTLEDSITEILTESKEEE